MKQTPYWNPYLAGVGLGLVLLSAFLIMGRGLGATGGFASISAAVAGTIAPETAKMNPVFAAHLSGGPWGSMKDWLIFELIGVLIGAFISGKLAGRAKFEVIKGKYTSRNKRIFLAVLGGILMGAGAKIARGCTSGQALTGGAMLSVGAWVFMICVFAGGYLFASFMRKEWQ